MSNCYKIVKCPHCELLVLVYIKDYNCKIFRHGTYKNDLTKQKTLIDLSLSLISDPDACNNFNLILVLYFCSRNINYRENQIKEFCIDRLKIYKQYYWSEHGGFSFFERNSNRGYYGAKISKGLEEPDIHGTHLFLWGITLITKMLNVDKSFNLSLPIT